MMMVVLLKVRQQVVFPLPSQGLMDQEGHLGLPFFYWGYHILPLVGKSEGQVLLFCRLIIVRLREESCSPSTVVTG
jgi:hypothetical protein